MLVPTNSLLVVSYTCDKPRFTDRGHCKDYRHPNGCLLPQATSATRRRDLARSCPGQRGEPEPASLDAITSLPSHSPDRPVSARAVQALQMPGQRSDCSGSLAEMWMRGPLPQHRGRRRRPAVGSFSPNSSDVAAAACASNPADPARLDTAPHGCTRPPGGKGGLPTKAGWHSAHALA